MERERILVANPSKPKPTRCVTMSSWALAACAPLCNPSSEKAASGPLDVTDPPYDIYTESVSTRLHGERDVCQVPPGPDCYVGRSYGNLEFPHIGHDPN